MQFRFFSISAAALLLTQIACSAPNEFLIERPDSLPRWESEGVTLYGVTFLQDINHLRSDREQFINNAYIGRIHFSGGYVTRDAEFGKVVESKATEFALHGEYREHSSKKISAELTRLLGEKGIRFQRSDANPSGWPEFGKERDYRKGPIEGKDNVNLPRYQYSAPQTIPPGLKTLAEKASTRYLLFPVVIQYYTHNAGWFRDQEIGCLAGVRIALMIVIYDRQSNSLVTDQAFEARKIFELKNKMSLNESYRELDETVASLFQNLGEYISASDN